MRWLRSYLSAAASSKEGETSIRDPLEAFLFKEDYLYTRPTGVFFLVAFFLDSSGLVRANDRNEQPEKHFPQLSRPVMAQNGFESVRALCFDVFGTLVNWRKTVTNHLIRSSHVALNSSESSIPSTVRIVAADIDEARWADFAQEWRNKYFHFTRNYDPNANGGRFIPIQEFFASSLKQLIEEWNLVGLWDDDQIIRISRIWSRLEPYPDTARGLSQLRPMFLRISTLSNGSNALLTDLMHFARQSLTDLLCAEDFGAYKPNPVVYDKAAQWFNLETKECAMVAAHLGDLQAARSRGMKTIYIERRDEEAWSEQEIEKAKREGWVDIWIKLTDGNGHEADTAPGGEGAAAPDGTNFDDPQVAAMSGALAATIAGTVIPGAEGGLVELVRRLREMDMPQVPQPMQ